MLEHYEEGLVEVDVWSAATKLCRRNRLRSLSCASTVDGGAAGSVDTLASAGKTVDTEGGKLGRGEMVIGKGGNAVSDFVVDASAALAPLQMCESDVLIRDSLGRPEYLVAIGAYKGHVWPQTTHRCCQADDKVPRFACGALSSIGFEGGIYPVRNRVPLMFERFFDVAIPLHQCARARHNL